MFNLLCHIDKISTFDYYKTKYSVAYLSNSGIPHNISGYTIRTQSILENFLHHKNIICFVRPDKHKLQNNGNNIDLKSKLLETKDVVYSMVGYDANTFTQQTFDVVVANILSSALMVLAPALAKYCNIGGKLALSGILDSKPPYCGFAANINQPKYGDS